MDVFPKGKTNLYRGSIPPNFRLRRFIKVKFTFTEASFQKNSPAALSEAEIDFYRGTIPQNFRLRRFIKGKSAFTEVNTFKNVAWGAL